MTLKVDKPGGRGSASHKEGLEIGLAMVKSLWKKDLLTGIKGVNNLHVGEAINGGPGDEAMWEAGAS